LLAHLATGINQIELAVIGSARFLLVDGASSAQRGAIGQDQADHGGDGIAEARQDRSGHDRRPGEGRVQQGYPLPHGPWLQGP
jgi:hypothetical protein